MIYDNFFATKEWIMNLIKVSYFIGGLYDVLLGLGLLILRNLLSQLLGLKPVNSEPIVDALSLFLIGYGLLLIVESSSLNPNLNVGYATIFIRVGFFLLILFNVIISQVEFFYIVCSLTDLLTGSFIAYSIIITKNES